MQTIKINVQVYVILCQLSLGGIWILYSIEDLDGGLLGYEQYSLVYWYNC
jgi:hypothetical protein